MKATTLNPWTVTRASLFSTFAAFEPAADGDAAARRPERSFRGTVISVDATEHLLRVRGWLMFQKAFNLGDNCVYTEPGNEGATVNMLRPGEKVAVNYQSSHGVLIADRVEQIPMRMKGVITALDRANNRLMLHRTGMDTELQLADDCRIVLRDGKAGTLDDIKIGNHVTIMFETPGHTPTARQIEETSREFAGALTAIDLEDR